MRAEIILMLQCNLDKRSDSYNLRTASKTFLPQLCNKDISIAIYSTTVTHNELGCVRCGEWPNPTRWFSSQRHHATTHMFTDIRTHTYASCTVKWNSIWTVFTARVTFDHYSPMCTTSQRVIDLRHFFMAHTRPTISTKSRQIMNTQAEKATMTDTETLWDSAAWVGVGEVRLAGVLQWELKVADCFSLQTTSWWLTHNLSITLFVNWEQTTLDSFAGGDPLHQ